MKRAQGGWREHTFLDSACQKVISETTFFLMREMVSTSVEGGAWWVQGAGSLHLCQGTGPLTSVSLGRKARCFLMETDEAGKQIMN